jgi:hypothetical protein
MNSINIDTKFFLMQQMLKIELLRLDSAKVDRASARKRTEKWSHTSTANHGCRYNFLWIYPSPSSNIQNNDQEVREHFRVSLKSGLKSTVLTSELAVEDIQGIK